MRSPDHMLRMLRAPQPSHRKHAIRLVKIDFPTAGSMGSRRVPDSGTGVMLASTPQFQHVLLATREAYLRRRSINPTREPRLHGAHDPSMRTLSATVDSGRHPLVGPWVVFQVGDCRLGCCRCCCTYRCGHGGGRSAAWVGRLYAACMFEGEARILAQLKRRVSSEARRRWRRLKWAERLAVVLILVSVSVFGVGHIVRLALSAKAVGIGLTFASVCLFMAACLVYLAFGSTGLKHVGWERWLASAAILVFVTVLALRFTATWPVQWRVDLAGAGFDLGLLAFLVFVIRWFIRDMSEDMSVVAARAQLLLLLAFCFSFPAFLVFLATNGNTGAFMFFNQSQSSSHSAWLGGLEGLALLVIPALLLMIPQLAHRRLVWSSTPQLTRNVITGWLATGAALSTGLFAFMLHFYGGPLAGVGLGQLAVGMLFAVALLVPIYRSVARACWERGVLHIIDLGRWSADWRNVLGEWRAAMAVDIKAGADSADSREREVEHSKATDRPVDPLALSGGVESAVEQERR